MGYEQKEPFTTPFLLLTPQYENVKGSNKKVFSEEENTFFCNFKTFGGTEKTVNGIYTIEDTAQIETWYDTKIKSDCRIKLEDKSVYEIINEPENVNKRCQYMIFKVKRVKGGV